MGINYQYLQQLNFSLSPKLPVIIQAESIECGLACLAMVASYHGNHIGLMELRQKFPISLQGISLKNLIRIAEGIHLSSRPVRLDLDGLSQLKMPCILHWDFSHFVVLKSVKKGNIVIHDPSFGSRTIPLTTVSNSFTGFALELWPNPGFIPTEKPKRIGLDVILGHVKGAYRSAGTVIAVSFALELIALISPLLMQLTLDQVLPSQEVNLLLILAIGFGVLMVLQEVLKLSRSWMVLFIGTNLNIQLRANVFSHLMRLPIEYFIRRSLGEITSRFSSIDKIQSTLTTSFITAILDGVMSFAILVVMLLYSPLLAIISIVSILLYLLIRVLWYRPLYNTTSEQLIREAKQSGHFLETARGIRTIKLYQRQGERRANWLALLVNQMNSGIRNQQLHLIYQSILGLISGLENILIVSLGAYMVIQHEFSAGVLVAFIAYKTQFGVRVGSFIDTFFEVKMLQVQNERLADIVLTEPEQDGLESGDHRGTLAASIEVKNLTFSYAPHEKPVLIDINFKVDAGEFVAITGPSGCGKSTLLQLILDILSPTEGQVLIGGKDIKHIGVDSIRAMIGTVMQDDVLFAGSIFDNISFFDSDPDFEWVEECAQLAAIHDDINAMTMGYNTLIGDMGSSLSGGQKQRVLLARALYKRPKILLLDEATSHLDMNKESAVNASIASLNITRLIVAHRAETISAADRVIAL